MPDLEGEEVVVGPDAYWIEVGEEVVLYQAVTRALAVLNPEAAALWRGLPSPAASFEPGGRSEGARGFVRDLIRQGFLVAPSGSSLS